MKIVGTGRGGVRGEDLAVFITSDELIALLATLRRVRDTVRHTPDWEFSVELKEKDWVRMDMLADALEDVSFAHEREWEVNL